MQARHTTAQQGSVTRAMREARHAHRGGLVWITGLSGAGKSTLAFRVEQLLYDAGCRTVVLDGDNIRHGLCADLGFSDAARAENIRRVGEVARLFVDTGTIVLAAFISPFRTDRARVRALIGAADTIEVHCDCSIAVCEARDVKGLYRRARAGDIAQFTGISSPYERPAHADVHLDTGALGVDDCAAQVIAMLRERGILD
jgi:adenylylsulfate kinase